MLKFSVCMLLFMGIYACKQKEHKPDKRLIGFRSKLVYDADAIDKLDTLIYSSIVSDRFNKSTDTIVYEGNKIYVSYLRTASGCSDYAGDITFKNDTLKLLLQSKSGIVCSERVVCRVTYTIFNKGNKQYFIKKYD